jgi:hypothetical protein
MELLTKPTSYSINLHNDKTEILVFIYSVSKFAAISRNNFFAWNYSKKSVTQFNSLTKYLWTYTVCLCYHKSDSNIETLKEICHASVTEQSLKKRLMLHETYQYKVYF